MGFSKFLMRTGTEFFMDEATSRLVPRTGQSMLSSFHNRPAGASVLLCRPSLEEPQAESCIPKGVRRSDPSGMTRPTPTANLSWAISQVKPPDSMTFEALKNFGAAKATLTLMYAPSVRQGLTPDADDIGLTA